MRVSRTKHMKLECDMLEYIQSINRDTSALLIAPADCGKVIYPKDQVDIVAGKLRQVRVFDFDDPDKYEVAALVAMHLIDLKGKGFTAAMMRRCTNRKDRLFVLAQPIHPIPFENAVRMGKVYREGELEQNPYIRDVHLENMRNGDMFLGHADYQPYEAFSYGNLIPVGNKGIKHAEDSVFSILAPKMATIDHVFQFPVLLERDRVWMSITPSEIETMKEPLSHAHGKVLMLGCGLGYSAYIASLMEDVESVTIVEANPKVISLFETYILPQFKTKDKIRIIHDDAFAFVSELKDGEYDYCFADIWASNADIFSYFRLRRIMSRLPSIEAHYWVEDSLALVAQEKMATIIRAKGRPYSDAPMLAEMERKTNPGFRYIEALTEHVELKNVAEVEQMLDVKNILAMSDASDVAFDDV